MYKSLNISSNNYESIQIMPKLVNDIRLNHTHTRTHARTPSHPRSFVKVEPFVSGLVACVPALLTTLIRARRPTLSCQHTDRKLSRGTDQAVDTSSRCRSSCTHVAVTTTLVRRCRQTMSPNSHGVATTRSLSPPEVLRLYSGRVNVCFREILEDWK